MPVILTDSGDRGSWRPQTRPYGGKPRHARRTEAGEVAGFDVDGVCDHVGYVIGSEIRAVLRKFGSDVASR